MWMVLNNFWCYEFLMISHPDQKCKWNITFLHLWHYPLVQKKVHTMSGPYGSPILKACLNMTQIVAIKKQKLNSLVINRFLPYSPHRLQSLKPQTQNTKESASQHIVGIDVENQNGESRECFLCMQLNIYTYQLINISDYTYIQILTCYNINTWTSWHIHTTTYTHINPSTYQPVNPSTNWQKQQHKKWTSQHVNTLSY